MTIYAKELQRRLDSLEPPVEQEFMKRMCSDFRAWLQQ
jgi:hypothetical protein